MPYSHSLLMDTIWAGALAGSYFLWRRYARGAWLLFAAVLSHWVLDFVSHRPDMPLAPGIHGGFGLGLWNSVPATLIVEGGWWLLAIIIYVRATRPERRAGTYAFWIGVVLLTIIWYGKHHRRDGSKPGARRNLGLATVLSNCGLGPWINRLRPVSA